MKINQKITHFAFALFTFAWAANANAQPSPWHVFVDAAYANGGSPADRNKLLGTAVFVGPIRDEYSEQHSLIGSVGVGRELSNGLFVTLSAGSSTNMKSRFGANTRPVGPPATLTATSSSKRDSALLLLDYRFFETNKFSAYAAAGIEYSRSKVDTEYVRFFIEANPPFYRSEKSLDTAAALELGARYALTPTLSIGPFARLLERQRSAVGLRVSVAL
jgi:opacity protein-like surface antigen